MSGRKVVDLSAQDDGKDEESGLIVNSMRIGAATNDNYKSGMKKIIEYYQQSPKWNCYVNEGATCAFSSKLVAQAEAARCVAWHGGGLPGMNEPANSTHC